MKAKITVIIFILLCQLCGVALCSGSRADNSSELKPKESDFTYENYLASLKFLIDLIGRYEKNRSVSWEAQEIGIPNTSIGIEGYMLNLRKENARLKVENARLRKDRNALHKATDSLKQIERENKKFLAEKMYAD